MMNQKKRMLITGVSGLLGNSLAFYFREKHDVLGLYHSHPVEIGGIETKPIDLLDVEAVQDILQCFKPDIIVHCAAIANIDFCRNNKKLAEDVNVKGTKIIVQSVGRSSAYLVFFSSDSVYDGDSEGDHKESEIVNPINEYSVTKLEGEKEVLKRNNSLVLRTNIFGWNIQKKYSLAEWILNELSFDRPINGFNDVHFSSIYTYLLAEVIEESEKIGLQGIFNCASNGPMTKYEFACKIADQFGLNRELIKPISVDSSQLSAKRNKNLKLNVEKIEKAVDRKMPDMMESIEAFHRDCGDRFRQKVIVR